MLGLQTLLRDPDLYLRGRRVGLVTHAAAVLADLTSNVDALLARGVHLTALFGPEHGLSGAGADATPVPDSTDPHRGLPIHSLYGAHKAPTPAMLAEVDVLVVDVQDVGARFYTFISTLAHVLRAAAASGHPVIVLDRPNPLDGLHIEGPLVDPGLDSFISYLPIPIRHGLTPGELARFIVAHDALDLDLTVVPLHGWSRAHWFDDTGLPWIPLSPAMPHLSTATVYPGACLVEGTNLSEGRGTALPFELTGAPWLDGDALARSLNALDLPGVRFRPQSFLPVGHRHAGLVCGGVQWHVTDRRVFSPVAAGLHVLAAARAQAPDRFQFLETSWEGAPPHLDLLAGTARVRQGLAAGQPVRDITADWSAIASAFDAARAPHLLYAP